MLIVLVCCAVSTASSAEITLFKPNFFIFAKDGQPFYPHTLNVSVLMKPEVRLDQIDPFLTTAAGQGFNSIRVVIDDAFPPDAPLDKFEEKDGSLNQYMTDRLDAIFRSARSNQLHVILSMFDIQTLSQYWETSPYNRKNGGTCESLIDYFSRNDTLLRASRRVAQLVKRYQKENILAWEIARGLNVWETYKGLSYQPAQDYAERTRFWLVRMHNEIRRQEEAKHLIALCYLPNTLPLTLMDDPLVDINFLQIFSSKTPWQATVPIPQFMKIARQSRKPVYLAQAFWQGDMNLRNEFMHNQYWAALAAGSGFFLSAVLNGSQPVVPDHDHQLLINGYRFLANVDLKGHPRPPADPTIDILMAENYLVVESLVGNDWLFWILRKNPGVSEFARMNFATIEGEYEYYWLNLEEDQESMKQFINKRKVVSLQSPPFGHDIIGRLRCSVPYRSKPREQQSKQENQPMTTPE